MNSRANRNKKIKKAMLLGAAFGAAVGVIATFAAAQVLIHKNKAAFAKKEQKLSEENELLKAEANRRRHLTDAARLSVKETEKWELLLVNDKYALDKKYVPGLTKIADGFSVDSRIAEDTKAMLEDGKKAGLNFYIVAAYRSYEEQRELFNAAMQERVNNGMSYLDAYDDSKLSEAVPGHSEHALGLAVDVVSGNYDVSDEAQKSSPEVKWLAENCSKYGFILRYPKDKENITNVGYEPWHFRYVGKEAAKEITDKKITLEEYLGAEF